jgi:hypothetical protein
MTYTKYSRKLQEITLIPFMSQNLSLFVNQCTLVNNYEPV